ncbi:hypothetical protein B0H16DRAFT_1307798 [Mycena metata]|uniref:Uncharacterized protein n=1 Tax=Mycena metata TaxID=1033252 RepID=A0AAD7JN10_9AGAR|nr:hypothetical protein B0H16DRAFT_1307798 [Mycena metata]
MRGERAGQESRARVWAIKEIFGSALCFQPWRRTQTLRLRTVLDETHRSIHYMEPEIASMATRPNLLGYLEHHAPDTDGSFSVCIAGGHGVIISQKLYESIPAEHRPALDTGVAGQAVEFTVMGGTQEIIGTTLLPWILTTTSGERIRLVLHALVLPKLFMGMFIGNGGLSWLKSESWGGGRGPQFSFDFGQSGKCTAGDLGLRQPHEDETLTSSSQDRKHLQQMIHSSRVYKQQ